jgi:hypothetical protein
MTRCHEYWAIAEANSDLFTRIHTPQFSLAETAQDEHLNTLKERYREILRELDRHTVACPICQK